MPRNKKTQPKIIGPALPNIPWEDRPDGCKDAVWRYSANPIIPRDAIPTSNSIFNSAAIPYKGRFIGVFRVDDKTRLCHLHKGDSQDGIHWQINPDPIEFWCATDDFGASTYGYDPRVCLLDGKYYITWCNDYYGPTIGIAWTRDFKKYTQIEHAFLPYNRNGVLFPRKIHGRYAMLSRPSDKGHTPFGDIFYSESPDLCYWGKHRIVMQTRGGWQGIKIGPGPVPIETTEGWLLFYHGVLMSCNGFVYSMGAAILDIDKPWQVKYRTAPYLVSPQTTYECIGDTPNVVFPCAALCDAPTGRIAVYYGAADTVTGLAFAQVDELIDFIKSHSEV